MLENKIHTTVALCLGTYEEPRGGVVLGEGFRKVGLRLERFLAVLDSHVEHLHRIGKKGRLVQI